MIFRKIRDRRMNRVQILDCTLRDGGYCNQWKFGEKNKKIIVNGLCDANTVLLSADI